MKCKFEPDMDCIKSELFEKWKDDKKETAWLTLGECPSCPIYNECNDKEEVKP